MIDLSILKSIAKQKRYTISELERVCSFSQGAIKRWNRIVPGLDKVEKVADVLGCSIDELCGREPPEDQHDDALITGFMEELRTQRQPSLSDDEELILQNFRKLTDADKYAVLVHVVSLANKTV